MPEKLTTTPPSSTPNASAAGSNLDAALASLGAVKPTIPDSAVQNIGTEDLDADMFDMDIPVDPAETIAAVETDVKPTEAAKTAEGNPAQEVSTAASTPADAIKQAASTIDGTEEVAPVEAPIVETVVPHPEAVNTQRDYAGFEGQDLAMLKGMPNQAFNAAAPRLKGLMKEASDSKAQLAQIVKDSGTPLNHFEHPEAHRINPNYIQAESDHSYASTLETFIGQQKAALTEGAESVRVITGADANGQPVISDVVVTAENQTELNEKFAVSLANLGAEKSKQAGVINAIKQNHAGRYKQVQDVVIKAEEEYFPFYKEGAKSFTPEVKQKFEDFKGTLPEEVRNHMLAGPVAKSFLLIQDLNTHISGLKQKISQLESGKALAPVTKETQLAGPSGGDVIGNAGDGDNTVFSPDDFGMEM